MSFVLYAVYHETSEEVSPFKTLQGAQDFAELITEPGLIWGRHYRRVFWRFDFGGGDPQKSFEWQEGFVPDTATWNGRRLIQWTINRRWGQ